MSIHTVDGDTLARLAARSLELEAERAKVAALEKAVSANIMDAQRRDAELEAAESNARALAANADRLADALSALRGRAG